MMAFKKTDMVGTTAVNAANAATEAGQRVLILRFNEKMTDSAASGTALGGLNSGIAQVEGTGKWRFESMTAERDQRTLGDRTAFYVTFVAI